MKSLKAIAAVVVSAAMLAGCSSSSSQGKYTAGTYTGSGTGMNGVVTATITVDSDNITDVELDVSGETPAIGGAAADTLVEQIKTAQSAEIDGVSGATYTSDGIKDAVTDALNQAMGIAGDGKMTAGTYKATAFGSKSDITVEVTVSEDAIESINVLEADDSPYISDTAVEIMPQRIIDAQSVAVDAAAGATITSSAIKTAVADCLTQAGANISDWSRTTEITEGEDVDVDVLVIGGGTSGLTAAMSVKDDFTDTDTDTGISVLVVESNAYGGGALTTCGGYVASFFGTSLNDKTGVTWTTDELCDAYRETYKDSETMNLDLIRTIADLTDDTLNSLMDKGFYLCEEDGDLLTSSNIVSGETVQFTCGRVVADEETGERSGDNAWYTYGGGAYLGSSLTQIAEDMGVDIRFETTATELIMDGNDCVGAKVQDNEHTYTINAKKVILATGYAGLDEETVSRFLPEEYGMIIYSAPASDDSFAQKQITALGGEVSTNIDIDSGEIGPGYNAVESLYGKEAMLYRNMSSVWVNKNGERFMNEVTPEWGRWSSTGFDLLDQGGYAYMIFDSTHAGVEYYDYLVSIGVAWKADTIEELADMIGVDSETLSNTIDTYNSDYERGKDSLFDIDAADMVPVTEAPYYAVRVNVISTGGYDICLYTDNNMNILWSQDGEAVGNLYGCGGVAASGYFPLCAVGLGTHECTVMTTGVYAGNCVREALLG